MRAMRGLLLYLAIACVTSAFQAPAAFSFQVPNSSMEPAIRRGARVFVEELRESGREELRVGQVVVFRVPGGPDDLLLKRVVAVGGDEVAIRDKKLVQVALEDGVSTGGLVRVILGVYLPIEGVARLAGTIATGSSVAALPVLAVWRSVAALADVSARGCDGGRAGRRGRARRRYESPRSAACRLAARSASRPDRAGSPPRRLPAWGESPSRSRSRGPGARAECHCLGRRPSATSPGAWRGSRATAAAVAPRAQRSRDRDNDAR